ncbi:class I SAM-dependent methyltransferase [Sciscionella sediminilitoris]|uniref:class I SAM-dependent methyltransferase n=1 Tax=Sciscionella sediminilitoris TaxID=1445613 RepID=UPI0004DF677A|nr:class I SAM-dependent methyltransferase [Sciscionella sp. SE31]
MTTESVRPSPNIWRWPKTYAIENAAQDVHGAVWAAIEEHAPFAGRDVVDIGCGDGFHLPRFAACAASVIGVEPHPPLRERARERVAGLSNAKAFAGRAQALPLPDASADVLHARTAYFFGPGCEPGLREADRILRPGGALVIVDLDGFAAPYGDWLRADLPDYEPGRVEQFFTTQGFTSRDVATTWRFAKRAELEAVLRIEFSAKVARRAIAETRGTEIPVGYRLRIRSKPTGIILDS